MREIFTNKGYVTGSDYNKNGIQYTVVEDGRPTWICVDDVNYQETSALVIHKIDEDSYMPEDAPLDAKQVADLHNLISQRVSREARDLGLEDPEHSDERIVTYLKLYKGNSITLGERLSVEDLKKEYAEVSRMSEIEIIRLTTEEVAKKLELKEGDLTDAQREYVFEWVITKYEQKQILSAEEIIDKYRAIWNLTDFHQLAATCLGLTEDQAENISIDQYEYLRKIFEAGHVEEDGQERDFTPEEMQKKYWDIAHLPHAHQLRPLSLGLTVNQAFDLTDAQYNYLLTIYENEEGITPKEMQDHYSAISTLLEEHQLTAFQLGLPVEQAEDISEDQLDYLRDNYPNASGEELLEKYLKIQNLNGNELDDLANEPDSGISTAEASPINRVRTRSSDSEESVQENKKIRKDEGR